MSTFGACGIAQVVSKNQYYYFIINRLGVHPSSSSSFPLPLLLLLPSLFLPSLLLTFPYRFCSSPK